MTETEYIPLTDIGRALFNGRPADPEHSYDRGKTGFEGLPVQRPGDQQYTLFTSDAYWDADDDIRLVSGDDYMYVDVRELQIRKADLPQRVKEALGIVVDVPSTPTTLVPITENFGNVTCGDTVQIIDTITGVSLPGVGYAGVNGILSEDTSPVFRRVLFNNDDVPGYNRLAIKPWSDNGDGTHHWKVHAREALKVGGAVTPDGEDEDMKNATKEALNAYKKERDSQILRVAKKYGRVHGLCEVLADALRELDINPDTENTVEVTFTFKVDRDWGAERIDKYEVQRILYDALNALNEAKTKLYGHPRDLDVISVSTVRSEEVES